MTRDERHAEIEDSLATALAFLEITVMDQKMQLTEAQAKTLLVALEHANRAYDLHVEIRDPHKISERASHMVAEWKTDVALWQARAK